MDDVALKAVSWSQKLMSEILWFSHWLSFKLFLTPLCRLVPTSAASCRLWMSMGIPIRISSWSELQCTWAQKETSRDKSTSTNSTRYRRLCSCVALTDIWLWQILQKFKLRRLWSPHVLVFFALLPGWQVWARVHFKACQSVLLYCPLSQLH